MEILMAGVDYSGAALEQREAVAFTKTQAVKGMHEVWKLPGIDGCVIVSTCNRTELWLCAQGVEPDPGCILCSLKKLPYSSFSHIITQRHGNEAIRHLFETACGLHSRIWGEDQIITQIKDAAHTASEEGTAGKVLLKLFQTAVTSAKKVKTRVRFSSGNLSVASAAVEKCRETWQSLKGLCCLVVGSGNMGLLAAKELAAAGAQVSITLRKYKYGVSPVPENCGAVPYDERMKKITDADIIVSATASPHHTLPAVPVATACAAKPKDRLFLDLAVPRDIDPDVGAIPGCRLLTIDEISCGVREENKANTEAECQSIIEYYISEFHKQLIAWSSLPAIKSLSEELADSLWNDLMKELESSDMGLEERNRLYETTRKIIRKRACRTLFSFRDWMEDNADSLKTAGGFRTAR